MDVSQYHSVKDVYLLQKDNGGVVMVNFYPGYISCNSSYATVAQVADHIDYIKNLIGADYVGIGADYDGVPVYVIWIIHSKLF